MEPVNKKHHRSEVSSYSPEAVVEIEELRAQLTERLISHLQAHAQGSERDERIANLEGTLSAVAQEIDRYEGSDEESSIESESVDLDSNAQEIDRYEASDEESSIESDSAWDPWHQERFEEYDREYFASLSSWAPTRYETIVGMLQPGGWPEGQDDLDISWPVVPYIINNVDAFCKLLRGQAIKRVQVELCQRDFADINFAHIDQDLYLECLRKLGKALGTIPEMEELRLHEMEDFTAAACIVKETRQIRKLELKVGNDCPVNLERDSARLMADALCGHTSLEAIDMVVYASPEEFAIITSTFPTLPMLRKVGNASNTNLKAEHPQALSQLLRMPIREVTLSSCKFSELGLSAIAEALDGSPLSKLQFILCDFPKNKKSATEIVAAVKRNYVLEEFEVLLTDEMGCGPKFFDPNQRSVLSSITRLNKAGRRYMVEDPTSVGKGVQVLIEVKDDLDCLFLHLLENPLLCKSQEAPQYSSKKRKAEESIHT